jgi:hypothetical protein
VRRNKDKCTRKKGCSLSLGRQHLRSPHLDATRRCENGTGVALTLRLHEGTIYSRRAKECEEKHVSPVALLKLVVKHRVKFQVVDRREKLGGQQFDYPQRFDAANMMVSVIQPLDR